MRYFLIVLCICVVTSVHAEEICIIDRPPLVERIENRSYPSVFGFSQFDLLNKRPPDDVWEWSYHKEMLAYHDLFFTGTAFRAVSTRHFPQPQLIVDTGPLWYVHQERNEVQELNPNFLFLAGLDYYGSSSKSYPEDWSYWLRDEAGNRVEDEGWDALLIDYTLPGAQDHIVKQAIVIAKCGIFDGIILDWWGENEDNEAITGVDGAGHLYHGNRADALVSLARRIREAVGDDFLIIVNTDEKIPRSAPYINGAFMETLYDGKTGIGKTHAREHFIEIENVLLWFEENFRYPQVNCLEAFGIANQPPDSPENQRQVRAFTTLSLTHSDGYVLYTTGIIGPFEDHHTLTRYGKGIHRNTQEGNIISITINNTGILSMMPISVNLSAVMKRKVNFTRTEKAYSSVSSPTAGQPTTVLERNSRSSSLKRCQALPAVWQRNAHIPSLT